MLERRFHLADILALLVDPSISWRGEGGADQVARYVFGLETDKAPLTENQIHTARRAIVSIHPELAALSQEDLPTPEFAHLWLRRRCREFGTYVTLPRMQFGPRSSLPYDSDATSSAEDES